MADSQTIDVYNTRTDQYRDMVAAIGVPAGLKKFIAAVPAGGRVLDFGCGVGNCAAVMIEHGLETECLDASAEMVKIAADLYGISVRHASFSALDAIDYFDGIWANFSLLHAPKPDLLAHLAAIHRALQAGGVFFIALKIGDGEERDAFGRFYAYYQPAELVGMVERAGFTIGETIGGVDKGLAGTMSEWIGLLCHK